MKMMEYAPCERPREKMETQGVRALSDAELLAVLLRSGKRGCNAIDMARQVLARAEYSLESLARMSASVLREVSGMGPSKAYSIVAAIELGRRLEKETSGARKSIIDNPEQASRFVRALFTDDTREECWCVFLKRSRTVLSSMRISEGGESFTDMSIRTILHKALELKASMILIAHNHPSGCVKPSKEDLVLTKRLKEALDTFDISLLDHIIISERGYFSFSSESEGK